MILGIIVAVLMLGLGGFVFYAKCIEPYIGGVSRNSGLICHKSEHSITLLKRCPANKKGVKIKPAREVYNTDHPAELVYTGATVGSVHMGGFHVNEAYTSTSLGEKTGRYIFWASVRDIFTGSVEPFIVNEIELSDELLTEAKAHPVIQKFLKDSKLLLHYECTMSEIDQSAIQRNMSLGNTTVAQNIAMHAAQARYLTLDDATAIYDWVCETCDYGEAAPSDTYNADTMLELCVKTVCAKKRALMISGVFFALAVIVCFFLSTEHNPREMEVLFPISDAIAIFPSLLAVIYYMVTHSKYKKYVKTHSQESAL